MSFYVSQDEHHCTTWVWALDHFKEASWLVFLEINIKKHKNTTGIQRCVDLQLLCEVEKNIVVRQRRAYQLFVEHETNCFSYLDNFLIAYFSPESVVTTMHEQNIICSKTFLDGTTYTYEQITIYIHIYHLNSFVASHVVAPWPMKGKRKCIRWS